MVLSIDVKTFENIKKMSKNVKNVTKTKTFVNVE